MIDRAELKQKFFEALSSTGKTEISRAEIKNICNSIGLKSTQWFTKDENNRIGRGMYRVPNAQVSRVSANAEIEMKAQVIPMTKQTEKSGNTISNVTTDLDQTDCQSLNQ